MRLTCPRCEAQYEIPEAVIPTSGREVECSACGQVWHQPGPAQPGRNGQIAAKSPDTPPVAGPGAPPGPAAADRPVLSRKLDDAVLAILREETERELSARAREGRRAAGQDHNPVTAAQQPAAPAANAPPVGQPVDQPAAPPSVAQPIAADPLGFDWPVTTVILPGEPLRDAAPASDGASVPATGPAPAGADAPAAPAASLGGAETPSSNALPPEKLAPEKLPPRAPGTRAPRHRQTDPAPDPTPVRSAPPADTPPLLPVEEPVASITDPEPEPPEPERQAPAGPRLPDAARLAATLTRALPQALPQAAAAPGPETAPPAPAPGAKTGAARSHPVPALRPQRGHAGYAAGFGLAAMLALALLGFYALAPRIEAGQGTIAEWRQGFDRARLWLHDSIGRIAGN